MNPPDTITFTWGEVGAICSVLTLLSFVPTSFLRLYIAKAIADMRDSLLLEMRTNFVYKEIHRPEMHTIKRELTRNETALEKASLRIDDIEIKLAKIDHK